MPMVKFMPYVLQPKQPKQYGDPSSCISHSCKRAISFSSRSVGTHRYEHDEINKEGLIKKKEQELSCEQSTKITPN